MGLKQFYKSGFGIRDPVFRDKILDSVKMVAPSKIVEVDKNHLIKMVNGTVGVHLGIWEFEEERYGQSFCLQFTKYDSKVEIRSGDLYVSYGVKREDHLIVTYARGMLSVSCAGDYFKSIAQLFNE